MATSHFRHFDSARLAGHMGVSDKILVPNVGVLIIRILLLRVLYSGHLFSETPT